MVIMYSKIDKNEHEVDWMTSKMWPGADECPRGSKDVLLKPCPASEQSACVRRNHLDGDAWAGGWRWQRCTCGAMRKEGSEGGGGCFRRGSQPCAVFKVKGTRKHGRAWRQLPPAMQGGRRKVRKEERMIPETCLEMLSHTFKVNRVKEGIVHSSQFV